MILYTINQFLVLSSLVCVKIRLDVKLVNNVNQSIAILLLLLLNKYCVFKKCVSYSYLSIDVSLNLIQTVRLPKLSEVSSDGTSGIGTLVPHQTKNGLILNKKHQSI